MAEENKIETNSAKAWVLAARPKTLSGAAVPVMIGVALAYVDAVEYGTEAFSWIAALLCLLFSFAMQIDANFINDFYDFVNGTDDAETRLGPRRACAQGWVKLDSMKKAIAITTCAACAIGLPLVYYGGISHIRAWAICWYLFSSVLCQYAVHIMCSYILLHGRCSLLRLHVGW